jgi:hypothetical protein
VRDTRNRDIWIVLKDKRQFKKVMRQNIICAECTNKMFDNVALILWQEESPDMPELHPYCKKMLQKLLSTPPDENEPPSMGLLLLRQWYQQQQEGHADEN